MSDYIIVTGYWSDSQERADFFDLWWSNTLKYSKPEKIYVVNSASTVLPKEKKGDWINLSYNLGHVHDLDWNDNPNKKFGGWSMSFLHACMLAFSEKKDLLYKEQDAIACGNWVDELYSHNKPIVMGRPESSINQAIEQSLFLVKNEVLLEFASLYIALAKCDSGPNFMRPELKFRVILQNYFQNRTEFTSMGYGRARPENLEKCLISGEAFYIQKLTSEEERTIREHERY